MMIYRRLTKPGLVTAACAVILTVLVGIVTTWIGTIYLERHSYFFDPVAYSFHNAKLYVRVGEAGRWSVAVREWLENGRHPLRTVPLVLLAPGLLAQPFGHVATALPMFGIFLVLLGWTVYRRTQCLFYALACMALFCAIPGLFSPVIGVSAYWLDLPAAFLVGGAVLCLLNSSGARDWKWLTGFGVLAACAALSRYVAGVYVFVMCAPVLAGYLLLRWRQERSFTHSVVKPVLLVGGLVSVLAGYFILTHFGGNANFYSTYGYALNQGIWASAVSTVKALYGFVGRPVAVGLAGILLINLLWLRSRPWDWKEQAFIGWLAVSHLVFLAIVVRVVGHLQAPLYALPPLFLVSVSASPWRKTLSASKGALALAGLILVAAFLLGGRYAWRDARQAQRPSPEAQARKAFDVALARAVTDQGERLVWNTYFDEYTWIPTMEAFYRFGVFLPPAGQDYFFSIHRSVFASNYPGLTPEEVSRLVYDNTHRYVDIVVVFADPAASDVRFDNEYSRVVARYVAQAVRDDPVWERVFVIEGPEYGALAGYRNHAIPDSGAYGAIVHGRQLIQP